MSLIAIFSDAYGALTGNAVKRIPRMFRLKAKLPGVLRVYLPYLVNGRKFSTNQNSLFPPLNPPKTKRSPSGDQSR